MYNFIKYDDNFKNEKAANEGGIYYLHEVCMGKLLTGRG